MTGSVTNLSIITSGDACNVTIIIIVNGSTERSSNPGRGCLHFILRFRLKKNQEPVFLHLGQSKIGQTGVLVCIFIRASHQAGFDKKSFFIVGI